jgi:hypothetical protein
MNLSTGEFYRQVRTLNSHMRICCFEGSDKLAGLYYVDREGYQDICGVDKGYVPEYTEWDSAGHIIKSGWRRVFLILLQLGLTTAAKIQKVCPGFFLHWSQAAVDEDRRVQLAGDPIAKKLAAFADKEVLTSDDILEVSTDIRAKDTEQQKEQLEKDRWFLQTWQDRGGLNSDKPKI